MTLGAGILVSVAHNLRSLDRLPCLISDNFYQSELLNKITAADKTSFEQIYNPIPGTNKRLCTGINQNNIENYATKLDQAKVDRRYTTLYSHMCCKPLLIATFRKDAFCDDATLNAHFSGSSRFYEQQSNRYTFLLELDILDVFINEDIAIYKIINIPRDVINRLPHLEIDFQLHDIGTQNYYCLQAAPYNELGRIINEARIEGILDNFEQSNDILGDTYIMDGIRYLINGYFRFGSSGAPYLIYDKNHETFKVNSVQSQASFIQLSINDKMDGNRQYVNGVATPLSLVEQKLNERLSEAKSQLT